MVKNTFDIRLDSSTVALLEELASEENIDWGTYNKAAEEVANAVPEPTEELTDVQVMRTLSDVVANYLTVDQQPFSFEGREYMKGLYDYVVEYPAGCRNQIWHTGRQVEKSTSQSAKSIALGIVHQAYKTLYIAPRFDQVTVFSQQRFKPMCEDSHKLWDTVINPHKTLWQVGAKQFLNGAFFNFRSCYLSADNARGISAHHLMVDEIQDIVSDAVPILEQCQSHAAKELKFNSYAGTPKTNSNVITRRYKNSCQFEWLVPCGCGHWNLLDDSVIGPSYFQCIKCSRPINVREGQWVPARPELLNKCWGFRIPQIMVPFKEHADILAIKNDPQVSRRQFFNECLGLPYDEGELVLTEKDLIEACAAGDGGGMWSPQQGRMAAHNGLRLFMGVDYGTAEGEKPSFTVATIGFFTPIGKFQVVYMEKFLGDKANLAAQPGYIHQLAQAFGVTWIGCDWGFGAPLNQRLIDEYGWPRYDASRMLLEYQYVKQKLKAVWNPQAQRYMIDRNQGMTDLIDDIRNKKVIFFKYEQFRPFVLDFTSIFIEFDDNHGTMKYDHEMPDDAFHSLNYAYLAGLQYYGRLVQTALPDVEGDSGAIIY